MSKILKFFKQKRLIYYAGGAVVLIVLAVFIFGNKKAASETLMISHSDFINQVYVSGKVSASEEVDMAFKKEGRIDRVYYAVGDIVKSGALVAKINAKDAETEVNDAEIALASARLALDKFKLENSEENMNADLAKAYDDGFSAVSDAFLDLSTVIIGLDDILSEDNVSSARARSGGSIAVNYREEAEKSYDKALSVFRENRKNFRLMNRNSPRADIEVVIEKTYETARIFADAIKNLRNIVDYLADDSTDASGFDDYKNTLADYTEIINGHLSALAGAKTEIDDYEESFPATSLDIKDLELTVKQKENSLQEARSNLSDYYIRAPFDGVVTKIDAKVGEIASPNTSLVTMMSADTFQIESYVPEVNIALIKIGDKANVTLDAYGEKVLWSASVVSIDPAETIKDGVSTYKIKLQFSEKDERIKSGMTANVRIVIFSKPNVVVVPGGIVFEEDGKKFVQVKKGNEILNKEVTLGDVSTLGQVEVLSGLGDGDLVILNPDVK